jgi:hypothetical protein
VSTLVFHPDVETARLEEPHKWLGNDFTMPDMFMIPLNSLAHCSTVEFGPLMCGSPAKHLPDRTRLTFVPQQLYKTSTNFDTKSNVSCSAGACRSAIFSDRSEVSFVDESSCGDSTILESTATCNEYSCAGAHLYSRVNPNV